MKQFWERSWDHVAQARVSEYVKATVFASDSIIDYLKEQHVQTVCDAGGGCGAYALKLAENGFQVSGFDIASGAVEMARKLLSAHHFACTQWKTADILATGYSDNCFDAVISRDVIDHMTFENGIAAVKELYRITRDGGCILLTLDGLDSEYKTEPHIVNSDGDYLYTEGKWKGMVFHPYSELEIAKLVQVGIIKWIERDEDGFRVMIMK